MELTDHVKPAPKVETVRTYSPDEEVTFINMVNDGAFVEAIADALDRSVNSVRGKALSLLRAGEIDAIPRKTARGVKTMLTRRGLSAADYDGASKKEKASA